MNGAAYSLWSHLPRRVKGKLHDQILEAFCRYSRAQPQLASLAGLGPYDLVVHIGAHLAEEARLYEWLGASQVVWFEADPDLAQAARKRLARISTATHTVVSCAVSDRDGELVTLNRFSNGGASNSLHLPSGHMEEQYPDVVLTGATVDTTTTTLSTGLADLGLTPDRTSRSLLVLDVQGHEHRILSWEAASGLLNLFEVVMVEVSVEPHYEDSEDAESIIALMKDAGFAPASIAPPDHGDMIFRRVERQS